MAPPAVKLNLIRVRPYTTFFVRRLRSVDMFCWTGIVRRGGRRSVDMFCWTGKSHLVVVRSLFDSVTLANASFNLARDACKDRAAAAAAAGVGQTVFCNTTHEWSIFE